ncbi:hypothetical protein KB221_13160 [Aquidulcibacter paucihalophilus]|nr:hypothetical protein KB221_13160 [Aquidulcibacter paucihalophilus]
MFSRKPAPLPAPRNFLSVKLGSWVAIEAKGWGVAIVPLVIIVSLALGNVVRGGATEVWQLIGEVAEAAQAEPAVIAEPPQERTAITP